MILGHYASAYLAVPHNKVAPLWLLLLCANLAEFLWLLLAILGVEPTTPDSILDATFQNIHVHMTYSHNLVPNLLLGGIVGILVATFYKDRKLAIWCMFLTCLHVWCDYIVGFEHQIWGENSMEIGLNSYANFPHLAILIEFVYAIACLSYYSIVQHKQGEPVPRKKRTILFLAFSIGILAWLPTATISLRAAFG